MRVKVEKDQNCKTWIKIVSEIKNNIIQGNLKSGSCLPAEKKWAKQLNVSRIAIHETICSLEMLGFVVCKQGLGNYFEKNFESTLSLPLQMMFFLSESKINEIFELRCALEHEIMRLTQNCLTMEQYLELAALCIKIEGEMNVEIRNELDGQFHQKIAIISKNRMISSLLNATRNLLELHSNKANALIWISKRRWIINEQHRDILRGFLQKDPVIIEIAITNHMDLYGAYIKNID